MIVLISYISQLQTYESLEWVCQAGFTLDQVADTFQRRFPTSTLLSVTQLTEV